MKFLDKVKTFIKERFDKMNENRQLRLEARKQIESEALQERKKQSIQTAIYKEKIRGEKNRKFYKDGGAWGALQRGMNKIETNPPIIQEGHKGTHEPNGKKRGPTISPLQTKSFEINTGINENILEDLSKAVGGK